MEVVFWKAFGFKFSGWGHQVQDFAVFVVVTLIGWGINVSLIAIVSLHLHLTHTDLDKNLAAVVATAISLFWNFIGYKVIVFKK